MAGKKMQNLRLELEELKHAEVMTDSTHLKQILLNVLGNAVKYTPEGGEIHVYIKVINERLRLL